jgi:hypothetical protein
MNDNNNLNGLREADFLCPCGCLKTLGFWKSGRRKKWASVGCKQRFWKQTQEKTNDNNNLNGLRQNNPINEGSDSAEDSPTKPVPIANLCRCDCGVTLFPRAELAYASPSCMERALAGSPLVSNSSRPPLALYKVGGRHDYATGGADPGEDPETITPG